MKLSGIHVYPVKSFAGFSQTEAFVTRRGLLMDRQWMLVDEDGDFLSQRECPEMALVKTAVVDKQLHLTFGIETCSVPLLPLADRERLWVTVWGDEVEAQLVEEEANSWLSDILGTNCRLVYMPEASRRLVDRQYANSKDDLVRFADGFPILLTNESSLVWLNGHLQQPVTMSRFRPNLVVSGFEPFEEDQWKEVKIGEVTFAVAKPCARCSITTIEPTTAKRGKEPLRTLAQFRTFDGKVLFGQNLIPLQEGTLRLDSTVNVRYK
ncbi:MAG TPA: MOSC domain-containing protein [Rhodothermales bacterium]|nr:MOSC domain-containing protein [Bacteroidota bacterium]HRK73455.1 MOSC domain-containing protein [Rhodothermales bacterium]HRR07776.1 MOSC domain-containing protein [Rhodothermales bacterium]